MSLHPRSASSLSSLTPVLPRPPVERLHSNVPFPRPSSHAHARAHALSPPRPIRPWPLLLLACADLAYLLHLHRAAPARTLSSTLVVLACARAAVCGGLCGLSGRWRARGGWVAAVVGLSVGAVVWEVCWDIMTRDGKGRIGTPSQGADEAREVDRGFLGSSVGFAIAEYLVFLFMYRLSPPPQAPHPFSSRLAGDTIRSPTTYADDHLYASASPLDGTHTGSRHVRYPSMRSARSGRSARSMLSQRTIISERSESHVSPEPSQDDHDGPEARLDYDDEEEEADEEEEEEDFYSSGEEEYDGPFNEPFGIDDTGADSDASSVSESSIIDLPIPAGPTRIPATSLSIRSGLNVAADLMDDAPVIGALVRRTRSARFLSGAGGLGRSVESESELASRPRQGNEPEGGYGTFGASPA